MKTFKSQEEHLLKRVEERRKREGGFNIIELGLALAIIAVILLGVYAGYSKIYIPTKANSYAQKISQVMSAIERAKSDNGGAYIAASGELTTIADIANQLGGTGASMNDVIGWTYSCPAASSSTVTVTTTDIQPNTLRDLVLKKARTALVGANVSLSGNKIQIQITNVPCR